LDDVYIPGKHFDVLLLLDQRIRDCLNLKAVGIDSAQFARNQHFYRDADNETLKNYHLVYRDSFTLIHRKEDVYQKFF